MVTQKNFFETNYRIELRDLGFFYKLSWAKGARETEEMFRHWERRPSEDGSGETFFGKWYGNPAYASIWCNDDGGLAHLSITWIEQVLSAEVVEGLKRKSTHIEKPLWLCDFFYSPCQGLIMLFSRAEAMLLELNFFAPTHPVTCEVVNCFKEMESRNEFIRFFNRSGYLKKQRQKKNAELPAARPALLPSDKIISIKDARRNGSKEILSTECISTLKKSVTGQKNMQEGVDIDVREKKEKLIRKKGNEVRPEYF